MINEYLNIQEIFDLANFIFARQSKFFKFVLLCCYYLKLLNETCV